MHSHAALQRGTHLHFREAFPCSVALVFRFAGALPWSVALVLRLAGALPCSAALVQRGVRRGRLVGCILDRSYRSKQVIVLELQAATILNNTVSSKRGSLGGGPSYAFLTNRSKNVFSDPCVNHFRTIIVLNKTVSSKRGSLRGGPSDAFLTNRSKRFLFRTPV